MFIVSVASVLIFSFSCNKTSQAPDNSAIVKTQSTNPKSSNQLAAFWDSELPYPSSSSATGLFQNKAMLEQIIASGDEAAADAYLTDLANQVAGYFYYYRGIDIRNDFANDPKGAVTLGIFYAAKEYYDQQQLSALLKGTGTAGKKSPSPYYVVDDQMGCFITAIGAAIGITNARAIWQAILAGATEQTAIAAVKLIGGRMASAITLVFAIYNVGGCLGWW